MKKLIILGAGTFALEVTDLVEDLGGYEIVGYVANQAGNVSVNQPVLSLRDLPKFAKDAEAIGAMVSTERETFIREVARLGFRFAILIHPSASVSRSTSIHPGVIIGRLVAIGCHAIIQSHVVINRGASIGHHTVIGPMATIGPGANIAGQVEIGARVTVGMGATVIEKLSIGQNSLIGAGSVVLHNVKPDTRVFGNPAVVY